MITCKIPLETPSKKNSKIFNTKTHTMHCSKRYQEWHQAAIMFINSAIKEKDISRCFFILVFTHGDKRKRDSDNGVNSIFDTLCDTNVIEDDNYNVIPIHSVFNLYKAKDPNCEIRIYLPDEKELYLRDMIHYTNIAWELTTV